MIVEEHLGKISAGLVTLDKELVLDEDVKIMIDGTVTKIEYGTNNDGSANAVYTIKGVIGEVVDKDGKPRRKTPEIYR